MSSEGKIKLGVTIVRYRLTTDFRQTLAMPQDSKVLCVYRTSDYRVHMSVVVDNTKPLIRREVRLYNTGDMIDKSDKTELEYIGTFSINWVVYHAFIEREEK